MIYVSKPHHNRIKDVKTHHELRKLVGEAKINEFDFIWSEPEMLRLKDATQHLRLAPNSVDVSRGVKAQYIKNYI